MDSPVKPSERLIRRHDLVFVREIAWRHLMRVRADLAMDPLVASWVQRGWPLVSRRSTPGDLEGVPLGLPLPPFAGKRRISVVLPPGDIVEVASSPPLALASRAAPRDWWSALDALEEVARQHAINLRVYGSLAWRALTGLDYLTPSSDVDVLFCLRGTTNVQGLVAAIGHIDSKAPMRIDGELLREDGAAASWREIHEGASDVLVKTERSVALREASSFMSAQVSS